MSHCLIVGAGPGLGGAIARRFGDEGTAVSLIARREEDLRAQTQILCERGINAQYQAADVADSASLKSAIHNLENTAGPVSTLIYNAAAMRSERPLDLEPNTLRRELEVNVVAGLICAQAVAPGMLKRRSGAILFTGGGLALEPYPDWTSLALGKAALRSLAFSLYKEFSPSGVHVAVITVCGIITPGGPFDPDVIANEYWRLATSPNGIDDRELIFQPTGTYASYNDR